MGSGGCRCDIIAGRVSVGCQGGVALGTLRAGNRGADLGGGAWGLRYLEQVASCGEVDQGGGDSALGGAHSCTHTQAETQVPLSSFDSDRSASSSTAISSVP